MEPEAAPQKNRTALTISIVALILVVVGAWWALARPGNPGSAAIDGSAAAGSAGSVSPVPAEPSPATPASQAPLSATVTYTGQGFSPSSITIAQGGTVTWVDQSGSPMWIASGAHPTHTVYDGTSRSEHCAAGYNGPAPFDQCSTGNAYTFTFSKAGTWKYHNHVSSGDTGEVMVVAQ